MSETSSGGRASAADRAIQSKGTSADAIYRMVARTVARLGPRGTILDVGCGTGNLRPVIGDDFDRYVGVDVVDYGLPEGADFIQVDLDTGRVPLPDGSGDFVVSVETIEHLENPREFFRELARLVRPGGVLIVTTPNQLSLLNVFCLLTKGRHVAFQDDNYPTHLSALLEVDLRRMAAESGLEDVEVVYSRRGRMPLTASHYPAPLSALSPRLFSDNVLICGRKPAHST